MENIPFRYSIENCGEYLIVHAIGIQSTANEIVDYANSKNVVIVDTREWEDYMQGHLKGALFAPLSDRFEMVTGSYIDGDSLVCLVVNESLVNHAVTALIRIGIDNITNYVTPKQMEQYIADGGLVDKSYEIDMAELKHALSDNSAFVLDVRNAAELKEEGLIEGAMHIAFTRLLSRYQEIPKDRQIYAHCRSGNRSAFALGFLEKHGYKVINVRGSMIDWKRAGGETVPVG